MPWDSNGKRISWYTSPGLIEEFRALWQTDETPRQIGAHFGLSGDAIVSAAQRLGFPPRDGAYKAGENAPTTMSQLTRGFLRERVRDGSNPHMPLPPGHPIAWQILCDGTGIHFSFSGSP